MVTPASPTQGPGWARVRGSGPWNGEVARGSRGTLSDRKGWEGPGALVAWGATVPIGPLPHVCPWPVSSCLLPGQVRSGLDSGSELGRRGGDPVPTQLATRSWPQQGGRGPNPSGAQVGSIKSWWPLNFTPGSTSPRAVTLPPSTPKLAETDFPLRVGGAISGGSFPSLGSAALRGAGGRLGHQLRDALPWLQLVFRGRHRGRPCPGG